MDDYRRLSRKEWGSKRRKSESRLHKGKLKGLRPFEAAELEVARDQKLGEDEVSVPYTIRPSHKNG